MKKFLIALLAAVCVVCGVLAAACKPKYYELTYDNVSGVSYIFTGSADAESIESGAEVKKGFTVQFTLVLAANAEGTPVVSVNGNELAAGSDGYYSFKMTEDAHITVTGITVINDCTVTFDKGDQRIAYYGTDGKEIESFSTQTGGSVQFTISVSVYYGDSSYTVLSNTEVIVPDSNGVYTISGISKDVTVQVKGLSLAAGFVDRADGGSGTAEDPYKIAKPVDLYYMADLVSDSFYQGRYAMAYYEMTDDLDMEGEQVFIIGDKTSDISVFAGNFNGNGHTISNFYISDTIIEQQSYTEVFLPYIGLFGYVVAPTGTTAKIYDLNLDNLFIDARAASTGEDVFFTGGIVGYGVGVEITNCTVNGEIYANTDISTPGYVGGIAGYVVSVGADGINYDTIISGCYSSVDITASGYVYGAGGIAGEISSYDGDSAAYIINCRADGALAGAVHMGGITGILEIYASIINSCYTGAYVSAYNDLGILAQGAKYSYAYAGGISAYIGYDSVIANCFSTGAVSADAKAGKNYAFSGAVAAYISDGTEFAETSAGLVVNSAAASEGVTINNDYIVNTLGWSGKDWDMSGALPLPVKNSDVAVTVNVYRVENGEKSLYETYTVNEYVSMISLYGDVIEEYLNGADGYRSYGYYFDEALTDRVPLGFVPTGTVNLYYGLADYSEVYGTYYPQKGSFDGEYFALREGGVLEYCYGAVNYVSYYTYDGQRILLYSCPLLEEAVTDSAGNVTGYVYYAGEAVAADGALTIIDKGTYTEGAPLIAVKKSDNLVYGSYYGYKDGVITEYVFNEDLSGRWGASDFVYVIDTEKSEIAFTIQNVKYTASFDENGVVVSVNGTDVTRYDIYRGSWEKSAASHKTFTFDGIGSWKYEEYGYDDRGLKISIKSDSGTYTRNADFTITLSGGSLIADGTTVGEDGQGFLTVNFGTYAETYYGLYSYAGDWKFFNKTENIELLLGGITTDGYGTATAIYGATAESFELTYEAAVTEDAVYILLYLKNESYGVLSYDAANGTLTGQMYSYIWDEVTDVIFCLYDDYRGDWISDELGLVNFNGLGSYDLRGGINYLKTAGAVTINGVSVGKYTLENSTLSGSFAYDGTTYYISYNEETGLVEVTAGGEDYTTLYRLDGWENLTLETEDGETFTFNGGGNISKGGVMTCSLTGATYRYKPDGARGAAIYDENGSQIGTLVPEESDYKLTINGDVTHLYVANVFTGSWVVKGGGTLEIGRFGGNYTASGTVSGKEVTFEYDSVNGYVSYTLDSTDYYLLPLTVLDITELALSGQVQLSGNYKVCIKIDRYDGWQGEYTAADGTVLAIDGFGNSMQAGTATLTADNGDVTVYTYTMVNDAPEFTLGTAVYRLKEVDAGTENALVKDGKSYLLVQPDKLYGVTAAYAEDNTVTYYFDGLGAAVRSDGKTFSYEILKDSTSTYEMTVSLSSDGETLQAVINYASGYTLKFVNSDEGNN